MAKTEGTDAERARVRELFGLRSDKRVAQILIDEGYDGRVASRADGKARQLDKVRRRVGYHRVWWRAKWRTDRHELTVQDRHVGAEEYVANLETRLEQAEEMLEDSNLRGTPRVQALAEVRQIEQAIAKARGIDAPIAADIPDDTSAPKVPFLGLVIGLAKVSDEVRQKIHDWTADGDGK